MNILNKLGITVKKTGKAEEIFDSLAKNFFDVKYKLPSKYVSFYWEKYLQRSDRSNSLNGKVFEYILATLFVREGMLPLYISAKVAFVPNVIYDLMFYTTENTPICFSAKTSMRERYKQADLEAIALKYVHRKAQSYLITLEEKEAVGIRNKIKTGDVIGLDDVVVATHTDFDNLIVRLKQEFIFDEALNVKIIESNQVITKEKVNAFLKL